MTPARDPSTIDMFDERSAHETTPGSLDYAIELRHVLSDALKKSPHSRYAISARMSELLGQEVTKSMLDAWTAESKAPWRFPFEYAAAFEVACDTNCLQQLLGRKRGTRPLEPEEELLVELGRLDRDEQAVKARRQAIRKYLGAKR